MGDLPKDNPSVSPKVTPRVTNIPHEEEETNVSTFSVSIKAWQKLPSHIEKA